MKDNACRVLEIPFNDLLAGSIGALLPQTDEDESFIDVEFIIDGKIHIETVPACLLMKATEEEAKQFISDMWDVYDNTSWN